MVISKTSFVSVVYLTCTLAITTLSMVLTVLVLNLYGIVDRPVPDFVKTFVLVYLARALGMAESIPLCCTSPPRRGLLPPPVALRPWSLQGTGSDHSGEWMVEAGRLDHNGRMGEQLMRFDFLSSLVGSGFWILCIARALEVVVWYPLISYMPNFLILYHSR